MVRDGSPIVSRPSKLMEPRRFAEDADDGFHRGRLTGTRCGRASVTHFALVHVEIDAVQHMRFAVPSLQIAHAQQHSCCRGGGPVQEAVAASSMTAPYIGFNHLRIGRYARVVTLGEDLFPRASTVMACERVATTERLCSTIKMVAADRHPADKFRGSHRCPRGPFRPSVRRAASIWGREGEQWWSQAPRGALAGRRRSANARSCPCSRRGRLPKRGWPPLHSESANGAFRTPEIIGMSTAGRCNAIRMFSRTLICPPNTAEIWKDPHQAEARDVRRLHARYVLALIGDRTEPEGARNLVRRLKQVVLPAPLGPISA